MANPWRVELNKRSYDLVQAGLKARKVEDFALAARCFRDAATLMMKLDESRLERAELIFNQMFGPGGTDD